MTTPTSGLAARGRQRIFFEVDFLGNYGGYPQTFYAVGCPSKGSTLLIRDVGVGGQIWGTEPPKRKKILIEFFSKPNFAISFKLYHTVDIGSLFAHKKIWKKFTNSFSRKLDLKFWGGGAFLSSPPWGAPTPDLTPAYYGPRDPDKNIFCSGGIGPHLGEILTCLFLNFDLLVLGTLSSDF